MDAQHIEEIKNKEVRRLIRILKKDGAPTEWIDLHRPMISQLGLMTARLELQAARLANPEIPMVEFYDNGGGQIGTRESSDFKAYESLFKTYQIGLKHLLSGIPKKTTKKAKTETPTKPSTVLEVIQSRRRLG